jgi:hypothetical protein
MSPNSYDELGYEIREPDSLVEIICYVPSLYMESNSTIPFSLSS